MPPIAGKSFAQATQTITKQNGKTSVSVKKARTGTFATATYFSTVLERGGNCHTTIAILGTIEHNFVKRGLINSLIRFEQVTAVVL